MKTYENMKPSTVLWIGSIPEHWAMRRNITLLTERDERSEQGEEQLLSLSQYTGITIRGQNSTKMGMHEAESLVGYKVVHENDIVMNIMLAWNGSTAKSQFDGIISPAYAVYHLIDDSTNPDYLHYLYKTPYFMQYFEAYSTGLIKSRLRLYPQSFLHLSSIVPPREEQDQIVHFLDWKVSEINRLINIKRKEIERLEELKKAVVSHAVTKGLDSYVTMKDSGVSWLGTIPAHWDIVKLRQILHSVSVKNRPDLPLLSVVREQGVIIRDVDDKEANHNYIPDDLSNYKMVREGQFAMNKMKAWQGSYGISPYTGIVSPAYFIFDTEFENLEYFHYAIRSKVYVSFFAQASDGIRVGQWDLQMDKMKEIPFFVPPADEQKAIVDYIKSAISQYEDAIQKLTEQVERLHECKTRLISDVVTGKIDVRGIEIPEYEYTAEEADTDSEAEAEEFDEPESGE